MMIADAVESASRTLVDPAPARIESLVHDIVLKRLLELRTAARDDTDAPMTLAQSGEDIRSLETYQTFFEQHAKDAAHSQPSIPTERNHDHDDVSP